MEADREGGRQIRMKIMFIVSSPLYCSKCFTLHPLPHLFIPTPSRVLWEALSHAAVTARRPFIRIITTAYSQVPFIQTNELWQRSVKQIAKASKRQQDGSN